ncbi:uncharacterized protein KY384_001590 [Bacidia gigantensis]|uniref:uncharacterized protein n=1 Tax=Bacidia gigantensis TaxID=2732470 RepID=UPI001D042297|nr:uncharacterized protein KY384_001590 [Bacidia gigantensis]KAG8533849.1 hypothetical protein KY384_001590 [Bacidia gigantensis]
MYKPNSVWTWAFVGVTVVQAAIILAFESYVFALFQEGLHIDKATEDYEKDQLRQRKDYRQTIPTFLVLYIFGFLYELLLVWDALRLKNTIQIIGLCLYNLGLLIYAAVQLDQISDAKKDLLSFPGSSIDHNAIDKDVYPAVKPFLIAIPCIIAFGTVCMAFVARKLYDEFAWTIYKHISADLRMKRRYLTYQIYIALLKFDFFFFLGFTVQFIVIVASKDKKNVEFGLTIAAVPLNILVLLLAGYFTRKENRVGVTGIIILYFAGLAYFLFKCVRMYQKGPIPQLYYPARKSLTTFAVLTIICIVITIINAVVCFYNFGKGLKPYILHRKVDTEEEKPMGASGMQMEMPHLNYASAPASNRMTID